MICKSWPKDAQLGTAKGLQSATIMWMVSSTNRQTSFIEAEEELDEASLFEEDVE